MMENVNDDDQIVDYISDDDKRRLVQILTCKLCHGIMRLPMFFEACQHTFCQLCIIQYRNRTSNLECPSCKLSAGNNNYGPNSTFRNLIEILFPEFTELNKKNMVNMYKQFRKIGKSFPNEEEVLKEFFKEEKIEIDLIPLKCEGNYYALKELDNKTIRVTYNTTIKDLQNFLGAKLNEQPDEIDIHYKNMIIKPYLSLFNLKTNHQLNWSGQIVFTYMRKANGPCSTVESVSSKSDAQPVAPVQSSQSVHPVYFKVEKH